MSWYRKKRNVVNNTIKKEEWLEHFKSLLEGVEELTEESDEKKNTGQADEFKFEGEVRKKKSSDIRKNEEKEERNEGIFEEDVLNKPPEQEEIMKRIRKLKKGKAAGEDGIVAEFLMCMPEEGIEELMQLIKDIWQKKQLIKRWRTASLENMKKYHLFVIEKV